MKKAVATKDGKGQPVSRWYYIDMRKALGANGDMDEAIFSTPEDHVFKNFRGETIAERDYSTRDKEFAGCVFPLTLVFEASDWRTGFSEFHNYDRDLLRLYNEFERQIIKRFEQYQIPQIVLLRETPKVAVCQVFEKVNTGGVSLTVFELLTATFAVDNFNLRDDWAERDARLKKHRALVSLENTDFLQAITLLVTQARRNAASAQGVAADQLPAISCKRKDALKVTTEDYKTWAGLIEKGLVRAAKFLTSQRIFDEKLDIHHIFPRDWCDHESRRIPAAKRDTIINKTAISARTNRSIGGRAPSEYLQRLRNSAGCDETRQRQILETHLNDYEALSSDDFDRFLAAREDALVRLIEAATGRPVARSGAQSVNAMDEEPTEKETEE